MCLLQVVVANSGGDTCVLCFVGVCVFQLRKKTLEVTVWDYDKGSSNDFLGEVKPPLFSLNGNEITSS